MIDVMVQMPGASREGSRGARHQPMEKLLWEIPGVEYIYSTSKPGQAPGDRALLCRRRTRKTPSSRLYKKLYVELRPDPAGRVASR